ncbi:MAG: preprotein translocase subunit SecG [Candidatus Omnitrophota bacterium]
MSILLILLHIVVCLVLILVILLQAGRGQGLTTSSFGGGTVQSILGTKASDFLTKATSFCAICFLFTCIGLNILETYKSKSLLAGVRAQAPVDLEQIKEALEKVKAAQADQASGTSAEQTAAEAADAASNVAESVPPAVADAAPVQS